MRHAFTLPAVRAVVLIALAAFASIALSSRAEAQAVPAAPVVPATLGASWTLPLESECISESAECIRLPLTGVNALTAIHLFVADGPIADDYAGEPTAVLGPGETQATYNGVLPNGATLYVRVKAVNSAGPSKFSGQATKLVQIVAPPGVPTNVTITLTIGPAVTP